MNTKIEKRQGVFNRRHRSKMQLGLILLCLPLWSTCAENETPDDPIAKAQAMVDEVCRRSQVGRFEDMEAIAAEAQMELKGAEGPTAYGVAAISALKAINELAYIVATGRNVVTGAFGAQAGNEGDLTSLVMPFFQDLENVSSELQATLQDTITRYPDSSLVLNECVIYFGRTPMMSLHGELDANDLRVWITIAASLQALVTIILAQDLGIDVLGGLEIVSRLTTEPLCQPNLFADKRCFLQLAAWALERYPRLLEVREKEGPPAYLRSREASAVAFRMIGEFVEEAMRETDDQADDFFVIEDVKRASDGTLIGFSVAFQNYSYNAADFEWFSKSFFDNRSLVYRPSGKLYRTVIPLDGVLVEDVKAMQVHFEQGGGAVDAHAFLMPFAQIAGPIIEAILADQVNAIIDSYDPDGSLRDGLSSTGISYSDLVLLLIRSVLPRGFVYLDFYNFTGNPVSLRSILPKYDYVDPIDGRPTLAIEWECGYYETASQICQKGVALTDVAHFVGYPYYFEADGIDSRFGYMALHDPSIGGNLLVDVAAAPQTTVTHSLPVRPGGPENVEGPVAPDNYVYNYGVRSMMAYVISLIEKVDQ